MTLGQVSVLPCGESVAACLTSASTEIIDGLIIDVHDLISERPGTDLAEMLAALWFDLVAARQQVDAQFDALVNSGNLEVDPLKFDCIVHDVLAEHAGDDVAEVIAWLNAHGGLEVRNDPNDPDGRIIGCPSLGVVIARVPYEDLKPDDGPGTGSMNRPPWPPPGPM